MKESPRASAWYSPDPMAESTVKDTPEIAIQVCGLSKVYRLYDRPADRLVELASFGRKKRAREFWALKDVSFEVRKGSNLGIIGPNGAGKSTFLRILAGRLHPSEGKVEVSGRVSGILELGTGLQPTLTGRQNARLNGLFLGLDPWALEQQLDSIIEFSELGSFIDQRLDTYSSGMKARLAFSVLTAVRPEILVLDEALATGDSKFAEKCTRFLRELCSSGCTTLIVSHDLGFLIETCEQLIWLDKGKVRLIGSPQQVAESYLAAQGISSDFRPRPKALLFRIRPRAPNPNLEYWIQGVELLAEDGSPMVHTFYGDDIHVGGLLEAAASFGFTGDEMRRAWGPNRTVEEAAELVGNEGLRLRRLSFGDGQGGAAYLPLALPPVPKPLPTHVRIWGENVLEEDLVLSVFVNGAYHELGTFGKRGGDLHFSETFDLVRLIGDGKVRVYSEQPTEEALPQGEASPVPAEDVPAEDVPAAAVSEAAE